MSNRRPENPKLWAYEPPDLMAGHTATSDEVVAVVRRGVESGTIKGAVRFFDDYTAQMMRVDEPGIYLVIGPVSDGGSET